jgi:regulatory protein
MQITGFEPQQKHKERLSIAIDGQFGFGLHMDVVADYGLKVGQVLSEDLVAELKTADAFRTAYDKAIGYLAARPRSEREMWQYLADKLIYHHPEYASLSGDDRDSFMHQQEASIGRIIQKLTEHGYIDDAIFAKWWIDNRRQFRPRGKRLLLLELQAKGVSAANIELALTTPDEEGQFSSEAGQGRVGYDEAEAAFQMAQKYGHRYVGLEEFAYKQKVGRYLASKGYDWELIASVLKRLLQPNE